MNSVSIICSENIQSNEFDQICSQVIKHTAPEKRHPAPMYAAHAKRQIMCGFFPSRTRGPRYRKQGAGLGFTKVRK